MRRIAFTFPQGTNVALGVTKGPLSDSGSVGNWGNVATPPPPPPPPPTGGGGGGSSTDGTLATFAAADWSLADSPGTSRDIVILDIATVPVATGYAPEYFEYERTVGATTTVAMVPWWINTALPRRLRVGAGQAANIRLRVVWKSTATAELIAGAWSDTKTVTPTLGPARLVFATDHLSGYAGGSFHVEAEGLGFGVLDPYSDIRYKWTLPATATPFATAASPGFPWPDKVIYGPFCVANFQTPGVHVLTCEATDGVTTVTDTVNITVTAWDGYTAWISSAGNFAGAAAADTLNTRHASIAEAKTAHTNKNRNIRYLLRGGETHGSLGTLQGNQSLIVGSFGGGRAVLNVPVGEAALKVMTTTGEVIVTDLEMNGPYDAATPNSISGSIPEAIIQQGGEGKKTLHNVHMSGFGINYEPSSISSTATPAQLAIGTNHHLTNCVSTNWLNMGILCSATGHFYAAGCTMKQKVAALGDAVNKNLVSPFAPWHGPIRFSRPRGPVALVMCDFGSWNGWGSKYEHQPCVRWNAVGYEGANKLYVGQCRTEGIAFSCNPNGQNKPYPQQLIWDKIHHIATTQPDACFSSAYGGAILRNLVGVQDNIPAEETGKSVNSGVKLEKDWPNQYVPSLVNGMTFIDLRNDTNASNKPVDEVLGENSGWTYRNLAILVPNRSTPQLADGPFDLATHWTPGYVGRHLASENGGALQTQYANTPAAAVIPVPGPTSGVYRTQDGPPPLDDFYGKLRPTNGTASRGALEPS